MSDIDSTTGALCGAILNQNIALNETGDTDAGDDTASRVNLVAYMYLAPVIILFGVIGDLLTIFVLNQRVLKRSSVIYAYLTILAFTDLCTQISVIPMVLWLAGVKRCGMWWAVYYANFGFPVANAFMGASVWLVVFLTLSQYEAVCHPFSTRFKSTTALYYMTGVAYLLSFAIYVPYAFQKSVFNVSHICAECPYVACDNVKVHSSNWYFIYQWVRESVSRFIPFILIFYLNVCILIAYRRSKIDRATRISQSQQQTLQEKSEREERRLLLLLVSIISVFFVCTIPAAPLSILVTDRLTHNVPFQMVRAVINMLEFTKFALNFYFYCMINPDIRKICFDLLLCRRTDKSGICRSSSTARRYEPIGTAAAAAATSRRRATETDAEFKRFDTWSHKLEQATRQPRGMTRGYSLSPDDTMTISSHVQSSVMSPLNENDDSNHQQKTTVVVNATDAERQQRQSVVRRTPIRRCAADWKSMDDGAIELTARASPRVGDAAAVNQVTSTSSAGANRRSRLHELYMNDFVSCESGMSMFNTPQCLAGYSDSTMATANDELMLADYCSTETDLDAVI